MNRTFSQTQKRYLYLSSDGRCQRCGRVLGNRWEAHHVQRWKDGGVTETINGLALCLRCHKKIHGSNRMVLEPRDWQEDALENFRLHKELCFLLDATPGSGKTVFSAFCTAIVQNKYKDLFSIIVVPTTALKDSFLDTYNHKGINLTSVLRSGQGRPLDFDGAVVTYQQLPNLISTLETWHRHGQKLFFVFDEIHHASEENVWGNAANRCGSLATKILAMTGTPFRSDGNKISFLNYNEEGVAISDASYNYRQSVSDNICRELLFLHDDGEAEYFANQFDIETNSPTKTRISDAKNGEVFKVANTIFNKDSEWLNTVLYKGDQKLDEYKALHPNAGGIIVCRPGFDDNKDKHLYPIAEKIEKISGEKPTVITHDDRDADAKIRRFRNSNDRWIVSVRKISEGVDIKRLRVMVMLSYPSTELLFRQLIGRVVRVENQNLPENATVLMAKFPQLVEWAARVTEEAKQGIKDREEKGNTEGKEKKKSSFYAKDCTHEHGGGTSMFGEQFDTSEIVYAESLKNNDPMLATLSVSQVAHLARKMGVKIENQQPPTRPLHEIKKEKKDKINKLANRIVYKNKGNAAKNEDFKEIRFRMNRALGVQDQDDMMDNYGIEKMDTAIEWLNQVLISGE